METGSPAPRRATNLTTLTRAVAELTRTEDRDASRAAIHVLVRAYNEADHEAGRRCLSVGCPDCGGPEL